MTPSALLACLSAGGLTARAVGDRLLLGPASLVTPELKALVAEHKAGLLELLTPRETPLERWLADHAPSEPSVIVDRGGGRFAAVPLFEYQAIIAPYLEEA